MKSLKLIAVTITALGLAAPAYAGRDETQIKQQEKAVKELRAAQAKAAEKNKGLAGAAGPQGKVGPSTQGGPVSVKTGHPTERR